MDDLWRLGKPVGRGGPWLNTAVKAGQPSDPYLMTGFDRKRMQLSHDSAGDVTFTVEVNFSHTIWRKYAEISVAPSFGKASEGKADEAATHEFPTGYHAHWLRVTSDTDCKATAQLVYD